MKVGNAQVASELNACVSVSRDEAVSGLPEHRDERIRRHLQDDDAGREHEERDQEHAVRPDLRRRIEEQAAEGRRPPGPR